MFLLGRRKPLTSGLNLHGSAEMLGSWIKYVRLLELCNRICTVQLDSARGFYFQSWERFGLSIWSYSLTGRGWGWRFKAQQFRGCFICSAMEQSNVLAKFSFENLRVQKPGMVFWVGSRGKKRAWGAEHPQVQKGSSGSWVQIHSPPSRHRRGFVGTRQVALGSVRSWNIWAAISQHSTLGEGGSSSENIPAFVSLNTCCWRQNIWFGGKKNTEMLCSACVEEIPLPLPTHVVFLWLQLRTKKPQEKPRKVYWSKEQLQCKKVNEGFGEEKSMRVFIAWTRFKE